MASKALVLFGLFAVLLVVSEVAAAAERQSGTVKSEETVQPDQYGGGYKVYGGGGGIRPGDDQCLHRCCVYSRRTSACTRCCSYAGEAVQTQPGH